MPCTLCPNGKYKWGKNGECKYATLEECEAAHSGEKAMNKQAIEALAARYEKLGALLRGADGEPTFLAPYAAELPSDSDPRPELDVSFLGKSIDAYPSRLGAHPNRLEELRAMAKAHGVPAALLRDSDEGEVAKGFAERLMTLTASDETRDRYGDRILVDGTMQVKGEDSIRRYGRGWQTKNFTQKNPVFMLFHDYGGTFSPSGFSGIPAGQAVDTWTDQKGSRKRLRMSVLWDDGKSQPLAPFVMSAYEARSMRSFSVGFYPLRYYRPQDEDERKALDLGPYGVVFGEQDLLEVSAVAIPANPNCTDEERAFFGDLAKAAEEKGDAEVALAIRSAFPTGRSAIIISGQAAASPEPAREKPLDSTPPAGATLSLSAEQAGQLSALLEGLTRATKSLEDAATVLAARAADPVVERAETTVATLEIVDERDDDLYPELLDLTRRLSERAANGGRARKE